MISAVYYHSPPAPTIALQGTLMSTCLPIHFIHLWSCCLLTCLINAFSICWYSPLTGY